MNKKLLIASVFLLSAAQFTLAQVSFSTTPQTSTTTPLFLQSFSISASSYMVPVVSYTGNLTKTTVMFDVDGKYSTGTPGTGGDYMLEIGPSWGTFYKYIGGTSSWPWVKVSNIQYSYLATQYFSSTSSSKMLVAYVPSELLKTSSTVYVSGWVYDAFYKKYTNFGRRAVPVY